MRSVSLLLMIFFILNITGCESSKVYAPVHDLSMIESIPKKGVYYVQKGDTLYSIAWRYGLDYRRLAKINNIDEPYHIRKGQIIYLRAKLYPGNRGHKLVMLPKQIEKEPHAKVSYWRWPALGPLIKSYSEINKGINIGGSPGDPVYASAAGKVVYSGNGLRGYGNLIIIKHNSVFLSAYAHNQTLLVKQGDWVVAGQKIAEKGDSGAKIVMLHFEIRRGGQPVNPLSYLTRR